MYEQYFNEEIEEKIKECVVQVCSNEVSNQLNKELVGIEVVYFYDGEYIDLAMNVKIFVSSSDMISGGQGYTRYFSFTDTSKEIGVILQSIFNHCKRDKVDCYEILKYMSRQIAQKIQKIQWSKELVSDEVWVEVKEMD